MAIDERRRLEMFERLREILGHDVAETLLAHLPPPGERMATGGQVDGLRADMQHQFELQRHQFELHEARLAARWRRDLLMLAVPQFLVLLGIVVSLNV